MVNKNRQCFFFTENRTRKTTTNETSLPWKNTRMYMNKMTISEDDQFELCGFFDICNPSMKRSNKNHENIQNQINKLSAASGTVHLFISGINLTKRFKITNCNTNNDMGFISFLDPT